MEKSQDELENHFRKWLKRRQIHTSSSCVLVEGRIVDVKGGDVREPGERGPTAAAAGEVLALKKGGMAGISTQHRNPGNAEKAGKKQRKVLLWHQTRFS